MKIGIVLLGQVAKKTLATQSSLFGERCVYSYMLPSIRATNLS
ncbi:MAG: hypothetical protein ACXV7G_08730 [Halobacteriota archaeon]